MTVLATLSALGMAVGPPLIYIDQAYSIIKKKDSSGFSHDVCGVIIVANIIRIFFWLGNRFETPLLVQSILLIVSQLLLLGICLHYLPLRGQSQPQSQSQAYSTLPSSNDYVDQVDQDQVLNQQPEAELTTQFTPPSEPGVKGLIQDLKEGRRPWGLWEWEAYGSYLEFLAGLIVILGVLQIIFGRWTWYIDALGYIALTIESTLPIPQFVANYRNKSCYGFRSSTLAGWFFGDAFKTIYFFLRHSPMQFKVTAIMLVCWDSAVFGQRIIYGSNPPADQAGLDFDARLDDGQDEEARLRYEDRETEHQ